MYSELSGIAFPELVSGSLAGDYGSPTFLSGADPRILMVDDEKLNSYLVAELLLRDGFREVTHTSDSRRAIELIRERRPDAVLLDLCMPHRDGFEILSDLRNDALLSRTAVILLTAESDEGTVVKALELGARDVICKPFRRGELIARLRRMLETKADEDRVRRYVQMLEANLAAGPPSLAAKTSGSAPRTPE